MLGMDVSRARILHTGYRSEDVCMEAAVLESEVTVGAHGTVFHHESLGIAERLGTGDVAPNKAQVAAMPAEVFAVDGRVDDRDILRVPERILRVEQRVADDDIPAVLKGVVAVEREVLDVDTFAVHHDIVSLVGLDVYQFHPLAVPERLLCI